MSDKATQHAQDDADEALLVARRAEGKIDTHERECAVRWRAVDDKLTTAAAQRVEQSAAIAATDKRVSDGFAEVRSIMVKAAMGIIAALFGVVMLLARSKLGL